MPRLGYTAPVVLGTKDFLAKKGHNAQDIERMHAAWSKSVPLEMKPIRFSVIAYTVAVGKAIKVPK